MCESQNTDMFFEGVEKLLEIWFTANAGAGNACGDLRKIPRMELENLLETVKCKIISSRKNDNIDAYVLSESSMFISKRRFVLKTCGTTTPLLCLDALFKLVKEYAGFEKVEDFFYSRKNYKRPELQIGPHQNFQQEVAILDQFFPDGAAYCFGAVNKDWVVNSTGTRSNIGNTNDQFGSASYADIYREGQQDRRRSNHEIRN